MKAIQALIIFLIVVSIYISIRFQWRMAVGAFIALIHDLVLTAGVYSLVGFEVTPSTVVGLLTILGFSLYDTVVVYDKVSENSRDLLAGSRMTFSEAANLAVNQTLMRSINTSLISLLPVAGLLFVGAGILGVGTIEDLALILFVGLATGAYSSLFLATPIVCDLTERQASYKALTKRVAAKRAAERAAAERAAAQPELAAAAAAARRSGGPAPRRVPAPGPTIPPATVSIATEAATVIEARLRDVPDFPQPGIVFKDIVPLLADGTAFETVICALTESPGSTPRSILSLESRRAASSSPPLWRPGSGVAWCPCERRESFRHRPSVRSMCSSTERRPSRFRKAC